MVKKIFEFPYTDDVVFSDFFRLQSFVVTTDCSNSLLADECSPPTRIRLASSIGSNGIMMASAK
jgi:hypothetical protein